MYSLPTLSPLRPKKRKMEKFSMGVFLAYWGILAVKVKNKYIKMSVQKGAFTYKD